MQIALKTQDDRLACKKSVQYRDVHNDAIRSSVRILLGFRSSIGPLSSFVDYVWHRPMLARESKCRVA